MNVGWYVVYLLMCSLNGVTCINNGFGFNSWQFWAYTGMIIMSFIAGSNYRRN